MGEMLTLTDLMPTDEYSTFEDYLMPLVLVTYMNNKKGKDSRNYTISFIYTAFSVFWCIQCFMHCLLHLLLTHNVCHGETPSAFGVSGHVVMTAI